jgi:ATP-dependent helicase/nuclease subunit B
VWPTPTYKETTISLQNYVTEVVFMSLQFIIGPAGSGKTRHIVRSIVDSLINDGEVLSGAMPHPAPNILLLVPDQATFQMEKRVLEESCLEGFMRLQVLSFRRLAWKVLEETGGVTLPFMTAVGRTMAIQSILWENRKNLTVFAPLVNYPGFRDTLSQALHELYAYDIAPEEMQESVLKGPKIPFLEQKVQDLATVYREYASFLRGRFLDPHDSMRLSAEKMSGSSLVKGAMVFVDGFSGFTSDEYRLLEAIMEHAQDVYVALCMDRAETEMPLSETSLFYPTRDTLERLREIAWKRGIRQSEPIYLEGSRGGSRFKSSELAILEAGLRRWGGYRLRRDKASQVRDTARSSDDHALWEELRPASTGGVKILAAANPLTEVEFVAREILHLVRDEGYRYRDITVETREMEPYDDIIPLVFRDHGIPFFLDRKRPLSHHPLSELLRSAMDVALTGFSSEAVFRYLKTDLVPVSREAVDMVENYVLAHGITGERWISQVPWRYRRRYTQREESEPESWGEAEFCDSVRRKAVSHLAKFCRSLKGQESLTASAISRALYDLLIDLDVPGSLGKWQDEAEAQGDLASGLEHAGLWDKVMEILEQAAEILKDQHCDLSTYAMILDAGLEDIRLGVIPPSLDQVLVGTLDRSRQPECAVTFLIGALAGSFPKRHSENGIFTDSEREHLEKQGFTLDPGSRVRQLHEKYLVYIALTRPSVKLYISYPLGDQEGGGLEPSHIVGIVRRILGDKQEIFVPQIPLAEEDFTYIVPARIRGLTVRQLAAKKAGTLSSMWAEALRYLTDPERYGSARRVLEALSFRNQVRPLPRNIVNALYGETLRTSVSRLESFAACPFSHFAANGLRLKEREIYSLEPADAGTFLHEALKEFVTRASGPNANWADLAREEVWKIADEVTERLVPQLQDEIFMSSARHSYVARVLNRITRRAAEVLTEHRKKGEFVPAALEARFGLDDGMPPMRIPLAGGEVLLRGQIDRIDALIREGVTYLCVIDYKSSPRPLDLTDVYNGLSLQLLVYLLVAVESWPEIAGTTTTILSGLTVPEFAGQVLPAGALYFVTRDPVINSEVPIGASDAQQQVMKALRMSGLVTSDIKVLRSMDPLDRGYSNIIPVSFTKTGVGANSKIVPAGDFGDLLEFVREKVREVSGQILSGRADIFPFRKGQKRACTYCPYGPLCVFDVLVPGNQYRVIKPIPKEEFWKNVRQRQVKGGKSHDFAP